jgi:hypothetical protein
MYSLNQIEKTLQNFVNAHQILNSYGFGELADVAQGVASYTINKNASGTNDLVYPSMWATPTPSGITRHWIEYKLSIIVFDLVHKDESNKIEVLSDCIQILEDLINYLRQPAYEDYFSIDNEYSFTADPFTDRFNDEVSGWAMEITVKVPNENNICTLPIQ